MSAKKQRKVSNVTQKQNEGGVQVLYIHPAKQGVEFTLGPDLGRPYGLIPVGLPAVVNRLRQDGFSVEGINLPLERQLNQDFYLKGWLHGRASARLIMIDLHWYEHSYGAIDTARYIKRALPQARIVLGGLTASGFAREILAEFPEVDFIVRGDGETPMLELAQCLYAYPAGADISGSLAAIPNLSYRLNGKVVENSLSYCAATHDLDELDNVNLDFLAHSQEYLTFEYIVTDLESAQQAARTPQPMLGRWLPTARGCKYECSYCGGSKTAHGLLAGRNSLVPRSPVRVADDIQRLTHMGVHQASFTYDIAVLGKVYWQELFGLLKARNLQIGLYNECFQLPDVEFIQAFAAAGDRRHTCLALSPLCGNERVRRLNGKLFSNAELFDALEVMNRYNLYLFIYFSMNLPGMEEQIFEETLDLAREITEYYPTNLLKVLNTVHTMDPFSPMSLHPEKYDIQVSLRTFMDYYHYCRTTQVSSPEARSEAKRGFQLADPQARVLEKLSDEWDKERRYHERSWWLVPPSW